MKSHLNILTDLAKVDKLVSLVNKQDHKGNTALHLATAQKNLDLVCLLLKRDAKVGVQNSDGMTALNMVCSIAVKDSCKLESFWCLDKSRSRCKCSRFLWQYSLTYG